MKVALVTGGSRGIGAAVAEKFARSGYTVIVNYFNSEQCALQLQRRLNGEGCDVHLYRADVSRTDDLRAMFDWAGKYFKKIDVLVNNAGVALVKQLQDVTDAEYASVMDVNAKGTFDCCRLALPLLRNSDGAAIVNVSSIWGTVGASCESVYSMSKFAVVGLTESLASELAPSGITVNCVCPPIVHTDMTACLSQADVQSFCRDTGTRVYTPQQVACDIYNLATSGKTGSILKEV